MIYLSMRTAKGDTWEQTYGALKDVLAAEIERHSYLSEALQQDSTEVELFDRMRSGSASESDYVMSGAMQTLSRTASTDWGGQIFAWSSMGRLAMILSDPWSPSSSSICAGLMRTT